MPFVFDISRMNWSGDGDEAELPKASEFAYIKTVDYGGRRDPVVLRVPTGSEPYNNEEFESPQEARDLQVVLKSSGVAKVYCRYDGGNDEGFAWVDHAELVSGERVDFSALSSRLIANGLILPKKLMPWQTDWTDEQFVQNMLDFALATDWAAALLGGRGFGTGDYMYGAFFADLVNETITDDPTANAVVRYTEFQGAKIEPGGNLEIRINRAPPTSASLYQAGDRVVHKNIGTGTVTAVDGARVTVAFDSGKTAQIVEQFLDYE